MKGHMYKKLARLLWFFPVFFSLVFCASRPDLVGTWKEVGKTATIEFSNDGAFKAIDNQGMAVSGKYTLTRDGDLMCEIEIEGTSREVANLKVSIEGDELTLTSPGHREIERYKRER
jgi:hypothetical protein